MRRNDDKPEKKMNALYPHNGWDMDAAKLIIAPTPAKSKPEKLPVHQS
jgi:hypothetical protein